MTKEQFLARYPFVDKHIITYDIEQVSVRQFNEALDLVGYQDDHIILLDEGGELLWEMFDGEIVLDTVRSYKGDVFYILRREYNTVRLYSK